MLDLHGYGELHRDLNRMSKQGRWTEMAELVPAELVDEIAGAEIAARASGITDQVSLVNNRNPDPALFADIVADLRVHR